MANVRHARTVVPADDPDSVTAGDILPSDFTAAHTVELDTADVDGLDAALAGKASTSHPHAGEDITSGTVADARIAATIARDTEVTSAVAAEATLARNADNLTSGTVADARIAATIARDSEVTTAVSTHAGAADPHTAYVLEAATPGGELGGTYATPTVDATHSGSTHAAAQAAAEATAAAALTAHDTDTTSVHGITNTANLYAVGGTDVAVADGGTGASNAAGARANLDLEPDVDVPSQEAFDTVEGDLAAHIASLAAHAAAAITFGAGSVADELGVLSTVANAHHSRHENGGGDEIITEELGTGETDTALRLGPDGTGGVTWAAGGGGGAPTTVNYLVGTADAGLSAEIVVGTTPGGELGGTWASPTVDATHSGSTHAAAQAAAEATAAAALSSHAADTTAIHGITDTSALLVNQGTFAYLDAIEAAAPGTPSSGRARIYAKADGRIYSKDDAGVEYGPFDEAGSPTPDPAVLSGGTESSSGGFDFHLFTASGTLTVDTEGLVDVLIVGGGGGGGGWFSGGGGGGGGVLLATDYLVEAGSVTVVVGTGGVGGLSPASSGNEASAGVIGQASSFGPLVAVGGGGGGGIAPSSPAPTVVGRAFGGSSGGGGGRNSNAAGAFVATQGHVGGIALTGNSANTGSGGGGGGGGANGVAGGSGGTGGAGATVTEFSGFGASGVYGGGGGGGSSTLTNTPGAGGTGGGGGGGVGAGDTGDAGTANTGGGGGGGGNTGTSGGLGGAGGSGVVIVRTVTP